MSSEVIQSVLQGHPKEGWLVFRYRLLYGLFKLGMRVFFFCLFGIGLGFIALHRARLPQDPGIIVVIAFLAVAALVCLVLVLMQARVLAHARSNMVVVTQEGMVRSLGGRIREWPFSQISEVKMIHYQGGLHFPPDHAVEVTEAGSGRIVEVARHSVFEGVNELLHALQRGK